MKDALDRLYASFNHPESALDPIQIVRRYARLDDREVVGFVAAGLAFGRVASVMASIEAMCAALGPAPARSCGVSIRSAMRLRFARSSIAGRAATTWPGCCGSCVA